MVYESQISFTLDTICPWTYLAKTRLDLALEKFRASDSAKEVSFTVRYHPYQLYPEFSKSGEDKYQWYKKEKYNDSDEQMQKYVTLMTAYGAAAGVEMKFDGTIANTLDAHRLIQHYQEEQGPGTADKIVSSLYQQYFTQEAHPSAPTTLLKAAMEAGIEQAQAEAFIGDEYEGLPETRMLIREQATNGVDSVPHIVLEGKRRDITLQGAKEVEEYLKAMETIVRESQ